MAQYELNLRDYLRIFHKRKFIIVAVFIIITVSSVVFLQMQPAVYESSATIKLVERQSIAGLLTEWIVYDPADMMASQTKIIKGFPVMRKVAWKLGLIDGKTLPSEVDKVVVRLQDRVDTMRLGKTNIIKITAKASRPEVAMDLANTVARVYIEENLLEKREQASTARQFIEEQIGQLEIRLRGGEDILREFSEKVVGIKLAEPLQKKIADLQFELTSLLQKYTEKHPFVLRAKEQIIDLEEQLESFAGADLEYARLEREIELNRNLYGMLKEKLAEARITEAQKVGNASIVDPAVMPLAPVSPQKASGIILSAMAGLILGVALALIFETLDTSAGTIEDVEQLLNLPILGVIPSASRQLIEGKNVLARLKNKIFRPKEVSANEDKVRLIVHYEPTSLIAEAYRNIRTNLQFTPSKKCILIASAGPREGKTTILTNLGLAFAQKGLKTLLVSSDLRRPAIAKTFGLKKEPGLSEFISGSAKVSDCLRNISDIMMGDIPLEEVIKSPGLGNIWIFPSGHIVSNPAELLESEKLPNLIEELKQEFDIILFDSPPLLSITDASLLAPKVDGVILCYEIGRTARGALLRAKNQLELVGANISGLVLNHIAPQTETIESYPYYSRYKYTYSQESEQAKESKVKAG